MSNYDNTKGFFIPAQYTALNGAIQEVTLVVKGINLIEDAVDEEGNVVVNAQAELLRVIELLKVIAQPVITQISVDGEDSTVKFSWEQANVAGTPGVEQPSAKDLIADAEERIKGLFAVAQTVAGKAYDVEATVTAAF